MERVHSAELHVKFPVSEAALILAGTKRMIVRYRPWQLVDYLETFFYWCLEKISEPFVLKVFQTLNILFVGVERT